MKMFAYIISFILGFMVMPAIISLIPTLIWYTFDDALASAVNLPGLGNIPWYNIYGFTWFVGMISKGSSINYKNG